MKLELITPESATDAVKPILDKVQATYGFIPNTYGVMAHAPLAVEGYLQLTGLIGSKATLSPQEVQVVMLSVSAENGCEYCVAAHSAVAAMVKTPPETVQAIRDGTAITDTRQAALSAFTRSLVSNRGWVPEAEQQAFLAAGFTPGQVMEVVTITALKTLSNYANHLVDTPLDEAFASQAWKRPA